MDIDRLKQKAHMSSQFAGLTGPSEQDLADIESEDVGTGAFTSEQIEGLRRMNEKIDPAYARQRNKAGTKFSDTAARTTAGGAKRATAADALANIESAEGVRGMGGIVPGKEVVSSDFDPADYRRSVSGQGVSMGTSGTGRFESMRGTPQHEIALTLHKLAGPTCNHPRCQMLRARAVEMMGLENTRQFKGGKYWEAQGTPIPSIPVDEKVYPMDVHGKEIPGSRKNAQTVRSYKPANPKDPRWLELVKQSRAGSRAQGGADIFAPEDWLEHHHLPHEDDYDAYPPLLG